MDIVLKIGLSMIIPAYLIYDNRKTKNIALRNQRLEIENKEMKQDISLLLEHVNKLTLSNLEKKAKNDIFEELLAKEISENNILTKIMSAFPLFESYYRDIKSGKIVAL